MRYLGEIGHLGTGSDGRRPADLGIARAVFRDPDILIEGKDDRGKSWTASVQIWGGAGWTDAWIADFDGNSRKDLLIASLFPMNGRGCQPVHLTFLMMDGVGRPVPWSIVTEWPGAAGEGKKPALLRRLNGNGRAELMATDCEYAPGVDAAINRSIGGIFEARDAHWELVHPADLSSYEGIFRASFRETRFVHLLALKKPDSADLGNEPRPGASPLTLVGVQAPTPECSHPIHLPPMVNGRMALTEHNPCDELAHTRLTLSDGSTCYSDGKLTAVVDRPEGRELVEFERKEQLEVFLRELIRLHAGITLTGQSTPGRCSPTMLWAAEK